MIDCNTSDVDQLNASSASTTDDPSSQLSAGNAMMSSAQWLSNPCLSFDFFYNTVFIGTLCVLGIGANVLSIVVLYLDRHNVVATFLLRSLAVADIAVLSIVFVVMSVFFGTHSIPGVYMRHTRYAIPYLKKYVNPLGYMSQCATIWLTVLVAVNRYIAVCHPFKTERFLTINNARIQVAVVYALAILFNVPRIFQYHVIWTRDGNVSVPHKRLSAMGASSGYDIFYLNVFQTAVVFIFPLIVLVILNSFIIRQLQLSIDLMRSHSLGYIGCQEKNITHIIIVIIMVVVLCHTPDRILTVFKAIGKPENKHCPDPLIYASHFCNLLIVVNSSANFVIYCLFRRRFRRILCRLLCRGSTPSAYEESTRQSDHVTSTHHSTHSLHSLRGSAGRQSLSSGYKAALDRQTSGSAGRLNGLPRTPSPSGADPRRSLPSPTRRLIDRANVVVERAPVEEQRKLMSGVATIK